MVHFLGRTQEPKAPRGIYVVYSIYIPRFLHVVFLGERTCMLVVANVLPGDVVRTVSLKTPASHFRS